MDKLKQTFTHRQHMLNKNFEFFHYRDDSHLEVGYHHHDFYEIYFFLSGKVSYIIEGKSYTLQPWDILLVNNREVHKPIIEEGSKYNLLRPGTEILNIIKVILGKLKRALFHEGFGNDLLTELYLKELLVYLNKAYIVTDILDIEDAINYNPKINEIIHFINQNLSGDLSLDTLSNKFYSSKYHLLREFKKYTGYTLHNFIIQKRLFMSKILLRSGMSISDVCIECGFNNYSNFIRSFSKAFHVSPSKYAKTFLSE